MKIIYTIKEAEKILSDLKQCNVKIEDNFPKGGPGGGAYIPYECHCGGGLYGAGSMMDCSKRK